MVDEFSFERIHMHVVKFFNLLFKLQTLKS
jgi:hypothetical protein